jgi:hypothetical protein
MVIASFTLPGRAGAGLCDQGARFRAGFAPVALSCQLLSDLNRHTCFLALGVVQGPECGGIVPAVAVAGRVLDQLVQ